MAGADLPQTAPPPEAMPLDRGRLLTAFALTPLLSGFYATFTAIVPQGSGVSLLRSVSYFGGHGAQTPLVTLAIWGAAGCLLAIVATASRVNYRALYERCLNLAGRDRAVLRPGVLSPAD